ncbi:MAG: APC family permease [Longimicrobiales bacterium]
MKSNPLPTRTSLPRILGAPSAAAVMVGLIIGSGIFRVPASVAGAVEGAGAIGLVWLGGGLLSLAGSLVVAELSCLHPKAGGEYVFLREAWGSFPAFLFGWARLIFLVPASVGAISLILGAYLAPYLSFVHAEERWIAAGVILAATALNYRSLLWSALTENVLTGAKIVLLGVFSIAVLFIGMDQEGAFDRELHFGSGSPLTLGVALLTVMWTYSGWASVASMAGEVRDPGRNIPRGIMGGMGVVLVLYLVTNLAFLQVMSVEEMANSPQVAAEAASRVFGSWGAAAVSIVVVVATFSAVQASMMFNPRIFYAMGQDGLLFRPIGEVHSRFRTPHFATLLTSLVGIAFVLSRSFEQLAQSFILGVWPFHILMIAAVFRLRKKEPDAPRPYKTWGYPWLPGLFLLASVAMVVSTIVAEPGLAGLSFGLIFAGIPVYFLITRGRRTSV